MKRITILSVLLPMGISQYGLASTTGPLFLSQEFHASAYWYRGVTYGDLYTGGFDVTAYHPFSYSVTDGDGFVGASTWTIPLSVDSANVGVSGNWYSGSNTPYNPYGNTPYWGGWYDVSGVWTFMPAQAQLAVYTIYSYGPGLFQNDIWLADLTTSEVLINHAWSYSGPPFSVDPSHVYELRVRARANTSPHHSLFGPNGGQGGVEMVLDGLAVVPAPAALLLGAIGAGLVGWLRRRRALA